jgi:mRNA-degrading endonuclease RelE of RelBE toxin-antitoxin system
MGNEFIYKSGLSKEGININKAVRSWLTKISNEDRERFVNTLFDILQGTGAKSLSDLNNEKINAADAMIKALKTLDKETQRQLRSTIDLLIAESHKTILKSITNDITNIIKFGRKKIQRKGIQDQ